MATADLATTLASVTSSVKFCLPVQVPVEAGGGVNGVLLGVTAAVGIIVGAVAAVIVGWFFFRHCLGKVCYMLFCYFVIISYVCLVSSFLYFSPATCTCARFN